MKNGVFTEREETFLLAIMRYKYLNKDQIKKHFMPLFKGQSEGVYYKVMNRLLNAEFVRKITIPQNTGLKNTVVYYVTDKGAKYITRAVEDGAEIVEAEYSKVTSHKLSVSHYPHRALMVDFMIAFDRAIEKEEKVFDKFLLTDTEREKRPTEENKVPKTKLVTTDSETSIVPDIAFCLGSTRKNTEVLFLVEIDRGTETIRRRSRSRGRTQTIQNKYDSYLAIYEDQNFREFLDTKSQAFRVLTVTNKKSHIKGIQEKLNHLTDYKDIFLFSTHEEVQNNDLIHGKIWKNIDPKSQVFSLADKLGLNK